MTLAPARHTRRPRRGRARVLVPLAVAIVAFAVGIALGEALHDSPRTGQTTTQERTFTVRPESATVTVTAP